MKNNGFLMDSGLDMLLPVFDESTLLRQLGGKRDLARIVIQSAIGDMPKYFDLLEQAIAAADWQDAAGLTHKLTALVAQVGGLSLSTRLRGIDDALRSGATGDSIVWTQLRSDYHRLEDRLRTWLGQ